MIRRKFEKLNDAAWLRLKYEAELLSSTEIGKLVGCSRDSVRKALLYHGIPLRKCGDSMHFLNQRVKPKSKYDKLNDPDWLHLNYVEKKLCCFEIAQLAGVKSSNSVTQALVRFGIEIRDGVKAKELLQEDDHFIFDWEVLAGCLLGDGSYRIWNRESDMSWPGFSKKNKHYAHVEFVARKLFSSDWENRVVRTKTKLKGKPYDIVIVRSFSHKELLPEYRKWYPVSNDYVKVVPKDLELTQTVLLHWYLDDGSASYRVRDRELKKDQIRLTFCSESFTKEDQQFLCNQMQEKFGIDARVVPYLNQGTGYRIKIRQSSVARFFEVIGPCPPELQECMGYKWKVPTNDIVPRKDYPLLRDEKYLRKMYDKRKYSIQAIADIIGCSGTAVLLALRRFEIKRRNKFERVEAVLSA